MSLLLALLLVIDRPASPGSPSPHDLEVASFASTQAITRMASNRCADILIDTNLVRWLGQQAHYARDQDAPRLAVEARAVTATLEQAIAEAPSPQAWCDAVFRLYGPGGRLIPGLMARQRIDGIGSSRAGG